MKTWRPLMMNKDKVIKNMILFIEKEERKFQTETFTPESKVSKNGIVTAIMEELDKEVSNEN